MSYRRIPTDLFTGLSTPSLGITGRIWNPRPTPSGVDLSTPSLGITCQQARASRSDARNRFQLPLSGSRNRERYRQPERSLGLSTPSLGITFSTCLLGFSGFPFQLPLSGSLDRPSMNKITVRRITFNSLSRDHRIFQNDPRGVEPLSTPSLGITGFVGERHVAHGADGLRITRWMAFNSLSRDHISRFCCLDLPELVRLSTPSLEITREAKFAVVRAREDAFNSLSRDHLFSMTIVNTSVIAGFQLPLSGSQMQRMQDSSDRNSDDFQLPLSGSHRF